MSGKHTRVPWEAGHVEMRVGDAWVGVYSEGAPEDYKMPAMCYGPDMKANAERIVACVNALEGFDPSKARELILAGLRAKAGGGGAKTLNTDEILEDAKAAALYFRALCDEGVPPTAAGNLTASFVSSRTFARRLDDEPKKPWEPEQ